MWDQATPDSQARARRGSRENLGRAASEGNGAGDGAGDEDGVRAIVGHLSVHHVY